MNSLCKRIEKVKYMAYTQKTKPLTPAQIDAYLTQLILYSSLEPDLKREALAKLPTLAPDQKALLKLALLERLTIDAEKETLEAMPEEKMTDMTLSQFEDMQKTIENKTLAKEDMVASETQAQAIAQSLKQPAQKH